jgi:ribosomal protein S12 methylthiotransferase
LIATGCLVERYPHDLARELPQIDAFVGARNWASLPSVVSQLEEARAPGSSLSLVELAPPGELDLEIASRRVNGPSAYLKISDGCDQRCAFCAIPFMKGNHRSKPAELILREIGQLLDQRVREIVLVGQDTTRYGHDLGQRDGLAVLLEQITDAYPQLPWLRIMYAYPRHVTERFLGVLRERPQVLPYLDMPLQHTHPWTLARMRRPHRDTDDLVNWMRDRVPRLVLRTTFIVGFPGETEAEFESLLESVRRLRFDRVGVFTYSDEDGTAAFDMPGRVPEAEKRRRRGRLMAAARDVTVESNRRLIGSELDVLIEGRPEDGSAWYAGRSYRDAPEVDGLVLVKAEQLPVGEIVRVQIERALAYDLLARLPLP